MKHVLLKEQAICVTPFFVEAIAETTFSVFLDIDCIACLRQALAASEVRTRAIRELIVKVEGPQPDSKIVKCRVYDAICINPSYCDAHDACCAGDPACRAEGSP